MFFLLAYILIILIRFIKIVPTYFCKLLKYVEKMSG
jgi:hypothetical protein